jgi:hypothetical protein
MGMTRLLMAGFLVAHGGIHAAIWMSPRLPDAPFDAAHSWLFGDVRPAAMALAAVAALAFAAAGAGFLIGQAWWALAGTLGAVVSLGLVALTFTPWWLAAVLINVLLVVWAWPTVSGALR